MSRLDRKKRSIKELGLKKNLGIRDFFDEEFKLTYYINDEEYDCLLDNCSNRELEEILINSESTFSDIKKALNIINKYIY